MKIRNTVITDTGLVIDPDDDVDFIQHIDYKEIKCGGCSVYCNAIYPYRYD